MKQFELIIVRIRHMHPTLTNKQGSLCKSGCKAVACCTMHSSVQPLTAVPSLL